LNLLTAQGGAMKVKHTLNWTKIILILYGCFFIDYTLQAQTVDEIYPISITQSGQDIEATWNAFNKTWYAALKRDNYLGEGIPLLKVNVRTGNEELIKVISNEYFRGTLTDSDGIELIGTTVYMDRSDNTVPFTGFVSIGSDLYIVETDMSSQAGIRMRLEKTENDVDGTDDTNGNSGWHEGGSGGALSPTDLYPREMTMVQFPALDIYVDPSYVQKVGEDKYIGRIIENLAVANTIYQQSKIKQIHLATIILTDENISRTDSQGNIIHGLEKLRKYTVQPDGADSAMVYSGEIFSMPSLWGWAELGFACNLKQAYELGNDINTHKVGKAAFAIIDLPTLLQRGWILGHEMVHSLGGVHIAKDPLTYGFFQKNLALKDYVAGCQARSDLYETCSYDPQTKAFTDFYSCGQE
jgi:hypothetical protein